MLAQCLQGVVPFITDERVVFLKKEKSGKPDNSGKKEFQPYIPASSSPPEFTFKSVFLGVILAIVFGAANAYLGLKVGMTVSASIPAAVISMGVFRALKDAFGVETSVLENNMSQTVGSAGESLAAGVIFTVPALILMGVNPGLFDIFLLAILGGWMGVLFMIPLRRFLIVKEHGKLPYPEGAACAEVIIAGQKGGNKAKIVFSAVGLGALYKILMDKAGFFLWKEEVEWTIPGLKGGAVGMNLLPALLGVGYIIGPKIAALMLAGAALGWLGIIPFLAMLGDKLFTSAGVAAEASGQLASSVAGGIIYPSTKALVLMNHWELWNNYLRYIGAGAVALGGVVSLLKAMPVMISSLKAAFAEMIGGDSDSEAGKKRTDRDLPLKFVLGFVGVIAFAIYALPQIPLSLLGTFLVVMFTFFFVTVSSRIVGLVGSSSNPASGMTIATLLATTFILAAAGYSGQEGAIAAISIGAIVCIGICIAGDTSQDLKTGYLVGATPSKQQIGELIGVLGSALFIGLTISILHTSYGIGSKELAAPQATLMKLVVEGVLEQSLPWGFVIFGAVCAAAVELMGVGSLPFAIGLYLPIHLSTPIMLGAIIRWLFDEFSTLAVKVKNGVRENGILFASGLIAGDALLGVMLAPLHHYQVTPARLLGWWSENKVVNEEMFFRSADTASVIPFLFIVAALCWVLFNPSKESLEDVEDSGVDIYYPPEELDH